MYVCILNIEILQGSFYNRSKKITQDDRQKGIPLVVTYNPFLCHLGQTIRKKSFLVLSR